MLKDPKKTHYFIVDLCEEIIERVWSSESLESLTDQIKIICTFNVINTMFSPIDSLMNQALVL